MPQTSTVNNESKIWSIIKKTDLILAPINNKLSIYGTYNLYQNDIITSLAAAAFFGAIDVSFLLNNSLNLLSKNDCLNAQSKYFKFISQVLITLPSLVFAPIAIVLFNTPFPTDEYIRYYVAAPFISSVSLGFLSTIIKKPIEYHEYLQQQYDDNPLVESEIEINSVGLNDNSCSKVFFSNVANTMGNLSTIALAVGLGDMFAMLQTKNDNNHANLNLNGFYYLAPPIAYASIKATYNLLADSYYGSKAIIKKISNWCSQESEDTATIINSQSEFFVSQPSMSSSPVMN